MLPFPSIRRVKFKEVSILIMKQCGWPIQTELSNLYNYVQMDEKKTTTTTESEIMVHTHYQDIY